MSYLGDEALYDDIPVHDLADLLDPGGYDQPGRCICGARLPPWRQWDRAGMDWQNIACGRCGRLYVDEDHYMAIAEPSELVDWGYVNEDAPPVYTPHRVRDLPWVLWRRLVIWRRQR